MKKMSEAFKSIKQGLEEAIQFANGGAVTQAVVHQFDELNVKQIRQNVGMTQVEFATTFGISLGTLRHWERGDRAPHGSALALLKIIDKEPQAALRALAVAE